MKLNQAQTEMHQGEIFKAVIQIMPPLMGLASMDLYEEPNHLKMGLKMGLMIEDEGNPAAPFKPADKDSFRACICKYDGNELILTEPSKAYPESMPTTAEFKNALEGEITFLFKD